MNATLHVPPPGLQHTACCPEESLNPVVLPQDAMQRQTLVPLAPYMASLPFSSEPPRVIDVAAGTGRFATFMKVHTCLLQLHAGGTCLCWLTACRTHQAQFRPDCSHPC